MLGSGSGGNAIVLEASGTRILVDAGLSAKQLVTRLALLDIEAESLDGILLTHEHGDHTRGLDVFLRKRQVPVFTNALTREALSHKMRSPVQWRVFGSDQPFALEGLKVTAFPVQHDAADPVGFVVEKGDARVGIASDLGHITPKVRDHLAELDALFIESNYDDEMLANDLKRPFSTKARISSRHGHLSNAQVCELLADIACERLKHIVVGHLSADCNCPDLVTRTLSEQLDSTGHPHVDISCASQNEVAGWFQIMDRVPVWSQTPNGLQGELF